MYLRLKKATYATGRWLAGNALYSAGFSISAGLSQASRVELNEGAIEEVVESFMQAAQNHFVPALLLNWTYPVAHDILKNRKYYRISSHLFNVLMALPLLIAHYQEGTDKPIEAMVLPVTIGAIMTELNVRQNKGDLERKLDEERIPR